MTYREIVNNAKGVIPENKIFDYWPSSFPNSIDMYLENGDKIIYVSNDAKLEEKISRLPLRISELDWVYNKLFGYLNDTKVEDFNYLNAVKAIDPILTQLRITIDTMKKGADN